MGFCWEWLIYFKIYWYWSLEDKLGSLLWGVEREERYRVIGWSFKDFCGLDKFDSYCW